MPTDKPKIPAFNHHFRKELPFITVEAEIAKSGDTKGWRESFKVSSLATAEDEIRQVVEIFNMDRRVGEASRVFVRLLEERPTASDSFDGGTNLKGKKEKEEAEKISKEIRAADKARRKVQGIIIDVE